MSGKAFDEYASTYDANFSETGIGMAQRSIVWLLLQNYLHLKLNVLEINCGTGFDAFHFAPKVKSWLASDLSKGMIQFCHDKNEKAKDPLPKFLQIDARVISNLGTSQFDLVFSNFAGLNCLSPKELRDFSEQAAQVLTPHGKLVLVLLGQKCLWEDFYFRFKRDRRLHRRRTTNGLRTEIGGVSFNTYYYSPTELVDIFKHFNVEITRPVGFFIPPSFMIKHFPKNSFKLRFLVAFEKLVSNFSFLSNYSDHYIIVLQKKN